MPGSSPVTVVRPPRDLRWLLVALILVVLFRLPFLNATLAPDEGGFLILGSQWTPGPEPYGIYWVDRPPVLVAIFAGVDLLGGSALALRLVGTVFAALSVVFAWLIARDQAGPGRPAAVTALVTAALVCTPMFDGERVNGELLALPLVLGGIWCALRAVAGRRAHLGWGCAAAIFATLGFGIKQNVIDVFLVLAFCLVWLALRALWPAVRMAAVISGVSVVTAALVLAYAFTRGTTVPELWDAVIRFRVQAGELIRASASDATYERAWAMPPSFLLTGGAVVVGVAMVMALWPLLRRADRSQQRPAEADGHGAHSGFGGHDRVGPLGLLGALLLVWECIVVVMGGSYWLHYWTGVIPSLVLLLAWSTRPDRLAAMGSLRTLTRRVQLGLAAGACASTAIACTVMLVDPPGDKDRQVIDMLRAQSDAGQSAVVTFGHANILRETGLVSPYRYLWSLPARVRDPQMAELSALLDSSDRPMWVVTAGRRIATWGIDAEAADRVLSERYRETGRTDDWTIYRVR